MNLDTIAERGALVFNQTESARRELAQLWVGIDRDHLLE